MSRKDLANAIRALSMDAVQKPILVIPARRWAWLILPKCCGTIFLNITLPTQPRYDRDRFILSNGHASMLLYSLLHLTGYDLPLEELKNFRQLHSKPQPPGDWLYAALKPPPARLDKVWRTPSGWR